MAILGSETKKRKESGSSKRNNGAVSLVSFSLGGWNLVIKREGKCFEFSFFIINKEGRKGGVSFVFWREDICYGLDRSAESLSCTFVQFRVGYKLASCEFLFFFYFWCSSWSVAFQDGLPMM